MAKHPQHTNFAVLGLGRFGSSIVQTLSEYDVNILACDRDEGRLQQVMEFATHIVQADVADEAALSRLGLGNFDVVILAMGEDFEASLVATMIAKEQGAGRVIAKALNRRRKKILQSIGADEVILPEREMGARLARKLAGSNIVDILEESDLYTITEMHPREEWVGKTVRQSDIRRKHDLTILAVRRRGRHAVPVSPDHTIAGDDILIALSENK